MAITPIHTALITAARTLLSTGIALLAFISAGGYGFQIVSRLWGRTGMAEEEGILSAALGYGVISLLMIVTGIINLWTRPAAWAILMVGILFGRPFLQTLSRFSIPTYFKTDVSGVLILLSLLWGFLLALAPITYYDSLVYHMAMPNAYVQAHHWIGLKSLIYSAFPQMTEMLWTFALLLANDTVVNLTGFIMALLTVGATACFAHRFLHKQTTMPAAVLLITMPAFLLLSSGGYVDMPLTLYSFLSLYALFQWRDTAWRGPLLLSGLFAGLAISIKYTGGIPWAAGALLVLWRSVKNPRLAFESSFIYSGSAFLVVCPWLIKNMHYFGNPVFPFFYQWGNLKLSPWTQTAAEGYFRGVSEYQPRSILGLLRLPWDITVHSLHFGGGMDVLGDFGWAPFILLLPCLFFLRKRIPSAVHWLGAYALLFFIPWGMTRPVLRFLIPLAPVLALLCGVAWADGVRYWTPPYHRMAQRVTGLFIAYDFFIFFYITNILGSFPVALGLQSREDYLRGHVNYYSASQALERLPNVTKVFVLGDQRGYYYNRPVVVTPVFNQNPLVAWANAATSPQVFKKTLLQQGISHILVNQNEMKRLAPYGIFSFTTQGLMNWTLLEQTATTLVYQDASCKILAL